ncbi:MAG: hypothetical protein GY830_11335 [Bacteroidetes bacterium]|nr:hypothetical protein [Bacteroidota bacterium]
MLSYNNLNFLCLYLINLSMQDNKKELLLHLFFNYFNIFIIIKNYTIDTIFN